MSTISNQMTSLANAVRSKANISTKLSIADMIDILSGLSIGGTNITLGEIDNNGNFQPLSFDGTSAVVNGSPISVSAYYTWNNITEESYDSSVSGQTYPSESPSEEPSNEIEDDLTITSNLTVTISGNDELCPSCCSGGRNGGNGFFDGRYVITNSSSTGTNRIWGRQGCCGQNTIKFESNRNCWVLWDSDGECAPYPVAISENTDGSVNPWNLLWSACNGDTGEVYTNTTLTVELES